MHPYMSIRFALTLSCWSLPAISQTAVIETVPVTPEVPHLTVGATLVAGMSLGSQCHSAGSDTATCWDKGLLAGVRLAPRWRLQNSRLGIGFSTGFTVIGESFVSTHWWDGQLAARYYFGRSAPSQTWLDASLGALVALERVPTHLKDIGQTVSEHTISTWAPAASLALGRDAEIVRYFGLAPELRVSFYGLDAHFKGNGPGYNPQTVLTLGLSLVAFGFYR